jgi:3-oxoacyl-[acyl-carrier-protein] synthase I
LEKKDGHFVMGKEQPNTINVFTGNCVTPAGFSLSENICSIQNKNLAIKEHSNLEYLPTPFYGAIINEYDLDCQFKQCCFYKASINFSKLEKMMLLSLSDIYLNHKHFINNRCGLIVSSTKGNIDKISISQEDYLLTNLAKKMADSIGITSTPIIISNACVSGVMGISVAKRLIESGKFDHVILTAGDLFSKFVLSGFQSFQSVSEKPCKPYSKYRDGISLGEAAASIIITKDNFNLNKPYFQVVGDSSINDANHISGPSRTGEGLFLSIQNAVNQAQITFDTIDCISSHGTATIFNDEMEAQAFNRLNLENTPLYSLKGFYGHTLGASGLLETIISLAFSEKNIVLPSFGYDEMGTTLPLNISNESRNAEINYLLKTASGFGGANTAIVFKKHTI